MISNLYVDGFNLYFGAMKGNGGGYKWLDLAALAAKLLPKDQVKRIRYFTAKVGARPEDPQQPQGQQTYLRALRTIPNLTIHEGHYSTHAKWRPLAHPLRLPPLSTRKSSLPRRRGQT